MKNMLKKFLTLSFILLILSEGSLRLLGVIDFPIYLKDSEMGYIQIPNQSGKYLNKNEWRINEFHFFGEKYDSKIHPSIFLIGDSIVWCGNPYLYQDRLCIKLENVSGLKVWSVGAGSWSSWSEIAFIKRFQNIVDNSEFLVWIFNSGDFNEPTTWQSQFTHPTYKPFSALVYIMGKFVLPQNLFGLKTTQESGNLNTNQIQNTISFIKKISEKKKKTLIVLWPSEDELLNEESRKIYSTIKNELEQIKSNKIDFIDIIELGVINPKFYKDGIHPNPIGVSVLSEIISANLQSR
jgi:hypothetical protein